MQPATVVISKSWWTEVCKALRYKGEVTDNQEMWSSFESDVHVSDGVMASGSVMEAEFLTLISSIG